MTIPNPVLVERTQDTIVISREDLTAELEDMFDTILDGNCIKRWKIAAVIEYDTDEISVDCISGQWSEPTPEMPSQQIVTLDGSYYHTNPADLENLGIGKLYDRLAENMFNEALRPENDQ